MRKAGQSIEPKGSSAVHLAIIGVVTVLAYFNSIGNGFVGDDNGFVAYNVNIRDLGNLPEFFFNSSKTLAGYDPLWGAVLYRPLRTLSYALDYAVFGQWAPGFHITSLILHLASVATVYLLTSALIRIPAVSFMAALIFALHPVHIEAVSWISSRADLIGLIFANLSLLAYIGYKRGRGGSFLVASLLLAFISYLGKETMVFLPGLMILYDFISEDKKGPKSVIGSNLLSWALFAAITLGYLVFRFQMTGRMSTVQSWWGGTPYTNFLMMAKATALYIKLLVFPFDMNLHYVIGPARSIFEGGVIISAGVILATIALTVFLYGRSRVSFFLLAWFYLGLVPIANIIPNSFSMMAERYIYMPSEGPIIAMALGAYTLYQRARQGLPLVSKVMAFAGVAVMAAFLVTIISRNGVYKDDFTFYTAAVNDSPESAPSYKCLGDQYLNRKETAKALQNYRKALQIDPNYAEAMAKEGQIYADEGSFEKAIGQGEKAVALKPEDPVLRFTLGAFYSQAGLMDRAVGQWQKAIELYPYYAEAYNNLGAYYQVMGENEKALGMFEKSVGVNPFNAETHYNMALIFEEEGKVERSRASYSRFVETAGPEYADIVEEVKRKVR